MQPLLTHFNQFIPRMPFSVFVFSTIFGAVLLIQNLKDIGMRKEANIVLVSSILYTLLTIFIVNYASSGFSSYAYLLNLIGALALTEIFFKKYFGDGRVYPRKKIWKPLIISILIAIPFIAAAIYSFNHP